MSTWLKTGAVVAGGVLGGTVAVAAVGTWRWKRATTRAVHKLLGRAPAAIVPRAFDPDRLRGLPEPVQRYFAFALSPGRPLINGARFEQEGTFLLGERGGRWRPFKATEHFTAEPPGFVWDATIKVAPMVPVRVRDSYLGGRGAMLGKVAALVPVVDQQGQPDLAAGALYRYLAEAVWMPTALLPGHGVTWTAMDDRHARATLTDEGVTVSVEFEFGDQGEIVASFAPDRPRDVDGASVPTPWGGRYGNYVDVEGVKIPLEGEVAWFLPDGPMPYWRGRHVSARFW